MAFSEGHYQEKTIFSQNSNSFSLITTLLMKSCIESHDSEAESYENSDLDSPQQTERKSTKIISLKEIEERLKNKSVQRRCLRNLSRAYCVEQLQCLIEILENADFASICSKYLMIGSEKELSLSENLKLRLLEGEATIKDLKQYLLSDLRFNQAFIEGLL